MGSREDFVATWILESPRAVDAVNSFDSLEGMIRDQLKNYKPINITPNVSKILAGEDFFYWFHENDVIQVACKLERRHEGMVVVSVAKNPSLKNQAPFASDLYAMVLKDSDRNIRFMSDAVQSPEGLAIWKRLLKMGYKISVYDADNPGKSLKLLTSADQLDQYFEPSSSRHESYQFVLSEERNLEHLLGSFNNRRLRELSGTL